LKDVKEIRKVIASLAPVRTDLGIKVFDSFLIEAEEVAVSESPQDFGRQMSETKSMVNSLLDEGFVADNVRGLEELKGQNPETIYNIIDGAHPQLVATILAYLDDSKSASVLELFNEERRHDYIMKIARMDSIKPTALKDLALILDRQNASEEGATGTMPIGGTKTAANILNQMTPGMDEKALGFISELHGTLAEDIRDKMFMFVDLMGVEPISMQKLVSSLEPDLMICALKGQSPDLIQKFSSSMSQRQGSRFLEDLEDKPPMKLSDINDAQKQVLLVVKNLADKGDIIIPGKGEAYV
jgi:flagellar motor switch protein FliG